MSRNNGIRPRGRGHAQPFLWPAAGMMMAVLLLVAGAFEDVPSWWHGRPSTTARIADSLKAAVKPVLPEQPQIETSPPPDRDIPRREEQDLRARISRESNDLAELRAAAEQARKDLVLARKQAAVVRATATEKPRPAQAPGATSDPAAATAAAALTATPATEPRQAAVASASAIAPAAAPPTGSPPTADQQIATRRLTLAREALAAGRRARARWLLGLVRAHMTPDSGAGNPLASLVSDAIWLIDQGERTAALRAIDQILSEPGQHDAGRQ